MTNPSKNDLLLQAHTMIKDLYNGWPIEELHADPRDLLRMIEEEVPEIEASDRIDYGKDEFEPD